MCVNESENSLFKILEFPLTCIIANYRSNSRVSVSLKTRTRDAVISQFKDHSIRVLSASFKDSACRPDPFDVLWTAPIGGRNAYRSTKVLFATAAALCRVTKGPAGYSKRVKLAQSTARNSSSKPSTSNKTD